MKYIFIALLLLIQTQASEIRALIPDDYPDDSPSATNIPLNTLINGSYTTNNDIDWMKFTIGTDDGIILNVVKTTSGEVGVYLFSEYVALHGGSSIVGVRSSIYDDANKTMASSVNLTAGTYYIKSESSIYHTIADYTIVVKSADNVGTWSPDSITVEYCKNHLSECNIKPSVIIIAF